MPSRPRSVQPASGVLFALLNRFYFCTQAVRSNLQEALRVASGNGSEEDKLEARIEADVYEALQHALSH